MSFIGEVNNKIKHTIRNWLQIQATSPYSIQIQEVADFELSAIRNRIWYRGDSNEIEQLYTQCQEYADKHKFWASKCSPGMEMRKIHTGIPGLIVDVLTKIVLADMSDFEFELPKHKQIWGEMVEDSRRDARFEDLIESAIKDSLVVGDGAFKLSLDTEISPYPLIEWVPGERVDFTRHKGRLKEVVFRSVNPDGTVLCEYYGRGYIRNKLYKGDNEVDFKTNPYTQGLADVDFDKAVMLAVPFSIFKSRKYPKRGGSIFDSKLDSFDAFDEIWSQWMDAGRAGRAKTYIPESLLPRNPFSGQLMKPNAFDNRYIEVESDRGETAKNEVMLKQADIPHESYLAAYSTALDLCLQGVISPSTLGIDVKKLDNAEAQREKEKATLYTRNEIVKAIQDKIPDLLYSCINAFNILNKAAVEKVPVNIPFGEYANPSFESQVETVGKGKTQGIMSIEASVEELYGKSKSEEWKQEEVKRLKEEQGITEVEEQAVNMGAGGFEV